MGKKSPHKTYHETPILASGGRERSYGPILLDDCSFNFPSAQSLGNLLTLAEGHDSLFTSECGQVLSKLKADFPHLRFLQGKDGKHLNLESSLVRTAAVLLIAGQDESFFSAVQAKTNLESAGASGEVHNWHLMLPTSARVSPLTYAAVVATRYMELCRRQANGWTLGTFARGGIPGFPGGFHTVLWYPHRRASADYDLVVNVFSYLTAYTINTHGATLLRTRYT